MNPSRELLVFRCEEVVGGIGGRTYTRASAQSREGGRCTGSHLGFPVCNRLDGSENHNEIHIKRADVERPATTSTRKNHEKNRMRLQLVPQE